MRLAFIILLPYSNYCSYPIHIDNSSVRLAFHAFPVNSIFNKHLAVKSVRLQKDLHTWLRTKTPAKTINITQPTYYAGGGNRGGDF